MLTLTHTCHGLRSPIVTVTVQPTLVAAHEGSGSRLQTQTQKMTEIFSSGQRSQFNDFNYKKNQLNIKRWARHQSAQLQETEYNDCNHPFVHYIYIFIK